LDPQTIARQAYGGAAPATRTPRSIEYDAFARITHRLRDATARSDPAAFSLLVHALHENRRLWATLAADVAGDGNSLPQGLRARLFYLAEFTTHHTSKVLAGTADTGALIDVNTAVMRGLQTQGVAG
jgi:flagellar protein FlaF